MNFEKLEQEIRHLFLHQEGSHDFSHVQRVMRNAMRIAQVEGADLEAVQILALVHDYGDKKLGHDIGARPLSALLCDSGLDSERARFYQEEIQRLSFSSSKGQARPLSLEGQVVQDADRLEAIGAVGIARCFAYGGKQGSSLQASLQHFDDKLLKLIDLFCTKEGLRLAQLRHQRLLRFYLELREELE